MNRKFYATIPRQGLIFFGFLLLSFVGLGLVVALTLGSTPIIWAALIGAAALAVVVALFSRVGYFVSDDEIEFFDFFGRRKRIEWRDLTRVESEADALTLRSSNNIIRIRREGEWAALSDTIRPLIPANLLPVPTDKVKGPDAIGEFRVHGFQWLRLLTIGSAVLALLFIVSQAFAHELGAINSIGGLSIFGAHAYLILASKIVVSADRLVVMGPFGASRTILFSDIRRLRSVSAKSPYWVIEPGTWPELSLLSYEKADDIARFIATKMPASAEYVGPGPI